MDFMFGCAAGCASATLSQFADRRSSLQSGLKVSSVDGDGTGFGAERGVATEDGEETGGGVPIGTNDDESSWSVQKISRAKRCIKEAVT